MNRRQVLALIGVGVGVPSGYLGWDWYRSQQQPCPEGRSLPEGMEVETLYSHGDFRSEREIDQEFYTLFESAEVATNALVEYDTVTSFIEETNFDESYIVLYMVRMQSRREMELCNIERTAGRLAIEMDVYTPNPLEDDSVYHSYFTRITDERGDVPETITVNVEGYEVPER